MLHALWLPEITIRQGHRPMLRNIVLILLGLILFGVLATILETLGLKTIPTWLELFPRSERHKPALVT
jgi:hypothetical protein